TKGTCSRSIEVELDAAGVIQSCQINGGCPGNTVGLSQLVVGQQAEKVIERLNGIPCGMKRTSCPDQLCRALEQALAL
ncbi:MAG: TIGR03905 family TSCPD domain-containing protein, partial [Bacteroidaceae bacterium]|nr:TIGR03905 family TSCPD domain-containing protein [Bacteroidaceae bacterium]